jgi:hypothetical protein
MDPNSLQTNEISAKIWRGVPREDLVTRVANPIAEGIEQGEVAPMVEAAHEYAHEQQERNQMRAWRHLNFRVKAYGRCAFACNSSTTRFTRARMASRDAL